MSYINIRGVISMKEGSKNLLSSGQVAERLGLSKPHIYTLRAQGRSAPSSSVARSGSTRRTWRTSSGSTVENIPPKDAA
jgi:predicted DNA-binding transcriptional regulator AlpA